MKRHVTIGYIAAVIIAAAGVGMLATQAVKAQSLGTIEQNLLRLADENPQEFLRALKAVATDAQIVPDPAAFRDALVAEAFPGRGYDSTEENVAEWERLLTALEPFQGKAGTAFEGEGAAQIHQRLRSVLEVVPEPTE